jgi:hypothetical protein
MSGSILLVVGLGGIKNISFFNSKLKHRELALILVSLVRLGLTEWGVPNFFLFLTVGHDGYQNIRLLCRFQTCLSDKMHIKKVFP